MNILMWEYASTFNEIAVTFKSDQLHDDSVYNTCGNELLISVLQPEAVAFDAGLKVTG